MRQDSFVIARRPAWWVRAYRVATKTVDFKKLYAIVVVAQSAKESGAQASICIAVPHNDTYTTMQRPLEAIPTQE
jgi:hypothetical protein